MAVTAAWALVYLLAPPARNAFWAVNGLRSVPAAVAAGVLLVAGASIALVVRAPRGKAAAALATLALALVVAFPLREKFHLLGDSATRGGAILDFARGTIHRTLVEWTTALHAQPLDVATGLLLAAGIVRATHSLDLALSAVGAALALVYFAGAWRVARRLAGGTGAEAAVWLALVAWGGLQAFAGYAESAGVALAAAIWWWDAMLAPLTRPRAGFALLISWLALFGAHRIGLVLLVPQVIRLLAPPLEGDAPGVRRMTLVATLVMGALAAVIGHAGGGQFGHDVAELLRWPAADAMVSVPTDLVNLALLAAPLALLAALLGGMESLRRAARDPRAPALLAAGVLLLPTAFPFPVAASGLGIHRDWDLSVLLGLSLTVAGALALTRLPAARLRGALVVALPLLVLGTGSWLAVNADNHASEARARQLVIGDLRLGGGQASSVLLLMGASAMSQGQVAEAARLLEASWKLVPSPSRGLHAALAWLRAGDPVAARRLLNGVRARAGLPASVAADADTLEARIARVEQRMPRGR